MRHQRFFISAICVISAVFTLSGCGTYRETEKIAIVSGFALDKKDDHYQLSAEIIDIKRGGNISTKIVKSEGKSIFDAARETIKSVGKKLYWSHAEIAIISQEIAEEGLVPIADWIARDSEPRITMNILISTENTAGEILDQQAVSTGILAFELNEMLQSQKELSKAADIEGWKFLQDLSSEGISAILPTVYLNKENDKSVVTISGTAVFKQDKLVGILDGEDTETLLFIRNKIKEGVLVREEYNGGTATKIALEILKNKTKLKPSCADSKITVEIDTTTDTAVDEIGGTENYLEESKLKKMGGDFESALEERIVNLVKKVQNEFDSDIFGFGKTIKMNMPDLWRQLKPEWNEKFKEVDVKVHSTITIRNSAILEKPIKVGE